MELKDAVIGCLKESNKTLSHIDIFYALIIKDHISKKDRTISKIKEIKEICESLANEGVFIEKAGKFAYNNECNTEPYTEKKTELKDAIIQYTKGYNKTISLVELFNILLIKNLVSDKDKAYLKLSNIKEICENLVKEGVLIEKGKGKFAYNQDQNVKTTKVIKKPVINSESSAPKQTNALEMMWDFAEHKTNKKLIADDVFNFYAEEKKRGELLKTINDFIDYYKIEKNSENLAHLFLPILPEFRFI